MIVWLASYPRSGNTFARIVLESCLGVRTLTESHYFWPDRLRPALIQPWSQTSMGRLGFPEPREADVPSLRAAPELVGLKTHSRQRPGPDPGLYFVRDGRDALVSYAFYVHERLKQRPRGGITSAQFTETLRNLLLDPDPDFGSWSDNVKAWLPRSDVVVIPFAELIARPIETLTAALDRCGLSYTRLAAQPPTFQQLRDKDPNFFRLGRSGNWRTEFPTELLPLFWERNGDMMRRLGFDDAELASVGRS